MPMRGAVDAFVQHLRAERGLSANTLAAYRSDLRQFETFVRARGHQDWDLPPRVIQEFMTYLIEREYRQASQARKLAAVKALYRHLHASGSITTDPTAGLGGARVAKRRPKIVSTSDVERLLEQAADAATPEAARDRAMLEVLYATGMRVSELVALDMRNLDAESQTVRLGRTRQRTAPLSDRAADALDAYVADARTKLLRRADQPAVFLNHRGNRLTRQGFWLIIKAAAQRAGIQTPITPHTLRHSFAAHRLQGDSSVHEVQELLGHASPASTKVYVDLAREARRQPPGAPEAAPAS